VFALISIAATVAAMVLGYRQARSFVRRRLVYVDAVHSAFAPILAGVGAALVASPVVWLLPLVGTGTAVLFGAGVAGGVAAGARDVRYRRLPEHG
jgi:hypothetical protein